MVLIDTRRVGQVDGRVMDRDLHKITVGGNQKRRTVRRQAVIHAAERILDPHEAAGVRLPWRGLSPVVRDFDLDFADLLARRVQPVELAALLESDPACAERWPVDIVVGKTGNLADRAGVEVQDPDALAEIGAAVGQEEDLAPAPHRRRICPLPVGQPRQRL
jgi:hypothetical protein